jgi:pyridoxal phosphate enzyme (YggS family)
VLDLRARLDGVRARIARAAGRAGRNPSSVRLVAVSKTFPTADIRAVAATGHVDFGENKVQEALGKMDETSDLPLIWHLVGHLQSNKARKAGGRFAVIHSVDSADLVRRLEEAGEASGRTIQLLVQVDLSGESTKHGVRPEALMPILEAGQACKAAQIRGLMLLPPAVPDPQQARPFFLALRTLRDELLGRGVTPSMLSELSMGMSQDFEVAIEEGATMVRVGSAIFGSRPGKN